MNKHIKELAIQAGMVMYPTGLGINENTIWGDRNITKFAELLMAEQAKSWVSTKDYLPELFNVVGIKVSTYVLVYADGTSFHIACLWVIDNKHSWTTDGGEQLTEAPTYWQYLTKP